MDKRHKNGFIFLAVFIVFVIVFYNVDMYKSKKLLKQLSIEYSTIEYMDSINGYVSDILVLKNWRTLPFSIQMTLNGSRKVGLTAESDSDTISLRGVIKEGSLIQKKANSDTVYVINRNNNELWNYTFQLFTLD